MISPVVLNWEILEVAPASLANPRKRAWGCFLPLRSTVRDPGDSLREVLPDSRFPDDRRCQERLAPSTYSEEKVSLPLAAASDAVRARTTSSLRAVRST